MHCNGDILRNQSTFQFSSNKISICLITNLKRVDKHPRSVVLTDDGQWPLLKLFVKRMHNTCTRFMSWNGHWRSCSSHRVIKKTYGKYNSRALTRTQVIFPVIITWSCYNYHIMNLLTGERFPTDFLSTASVTKRISHWREVQEVMRSNLALGKFKFFNNWKQTF